MIKVSTRKILSLARKFHKEGRNWHFHILLPGCKLNKNKKYALILEDSENGKQYVHLSLKKPSKSGQKLVELLHGESVTKKISKSPASLPQSARVKKMIERAKELNNKGFSWHHHLLFPYCIFNKDSRYWTLVFEDPLNSEVIEERSSKEPIEALAIIEPLFYLQKR